MYLFYANDLGLRTCFENIIFFYSSTSFIDVALLYSFICLLLFSPHQQQQQQQRNELFSLFITLRLAFIRLCGEMRQRQQHKLSQEFQNKHWDLQSYLRLEHITQETRMRRKRQDTRQDKRRQRQATNNAI